MPTSRRVIAGPTAVLMVAVLGLVAAAPVIAATTPVIGPIAIAGTAPAPAADAPSPALPRAAPAEVGFSPERLDRLDRALQGYVDRGELAGIVALVARKGKVVHLESYGARHVEAKAPMAEDTIFRIASMTKPIASVALMMLWEEGRFQLRDPVSRFLPDFAEPVIAVPPDPLEYHGQPTRTIAARNPITIQHLLTHTAGLANNYRGSTRDAYQEMRRELPPDAAVADMVAKLAEIPLDFEPGRAWEYGPATDVVGLLVEVISGQRLDRFLEERIFRPLGMTDTHFYLPAEKLPRFAALYRPDADGRIELAEAPDAGGRYLRQPQTYFSGAGGLVSTAADYFRFHQMMLNGGQLDGVRILGRKTVELMTTNHTGDLGIWLRGPGYGFGLGYSVVVDQGASAMPASVGSYSWGGAFCTTFWVDPEEELIGVLMTQIRPYTHLNVREDFATLTYQALAD
ncbi:MAG TPA: serine hydrolase domain-containing protein [Thermoanaerobaculia bacterium]|nr:serine hydrolase domain-containing protein [Thermoanaerobaculia bacterium]